MSSIKKKKIEKENNTLIGKTLEGLIKEGDYRNSTTGVRNTGKKYFIWGGNYTIIEIAGILNLSHSYVCRRIREGYLDKLENYNPEITLKMRRKASETVKDKNETKLKELEEQGSFLDSLLKDNKESSPLSFFEDEFEEDTEDDETDLYWDNGEDEKPSKTYNYWDDEEE